jgi:hypothetical protein
LFCCGAEFCTPCSRIGNYFGFVAGYRLFGKEAELRIIPVPCFLGEGLLNKPVFQAMETDDCNPAAWRQQLIHPDRQTDA